MERRSSVRYDQVALAIGLFTILVLTGIQPGAVRERPWAADAGRPLAPPGLAAGHGTGTGESGAQGPHAALSLTEDGATPAAVSLSWTPSTEAQFYNYTVSYSTAGASGPWQTVEVLAGNRSETSFEMDGLSPGELYWWTVTDYGSLSSTVSNVLVAPQPTLPNLNATIQTSSMIQFNWTNNAFYGGLLSFNLYRLMESAAGSAPTPVASISTESTHSVTVVGLNPGTGYSFFLATTDCLVDCRNGPAAQTVTQSNSVTYGASLPLVASITESSSFVDAGQLDYFTCTPSGGQSPFLFAWDFGNGSFQSGSSSTSRSFAFVPSGFSSTTYTVRCRVTDSLASMSTAGAAVNVLLAPVVTINSPPASLDATQSATFNCTVTGGLFPYSSEWTFGDGRSAPGGLADHTYATPGQFAATCSVIDGTTTQATNTAIVTVNPALAVAIEANSGTAAPGTSLTFTARPTNGSGTYPRIDWNFGDGSGDNATVTSHAFVADGNYTVMLSVTDANQVTATNTTVVVITALSAAVSVDRSAIDQGGAVAFTAVASGGAGGPFNFTWSFGDGSTGYGASTSHTFSSAGTFYPTVTATDRLGATHVVSSAAITVTAPAGPAFPNAVLAILLGALGVGLVAAAVEYGRRRRRRRRRSPEVAG